MYSFGSIERVNLTGTESEESSTRFPPDLLPRRSQRRRMTTVTDCLVLRAGESRHSEALIDDRAPVGIANAVIRADRLSSMLRRKARPEICFLTRRVMLL
jgi:hypothetical protein